ncbi:MAG TPA: TetR/AcrR family transcriptional regulator [Baekduia sp.]|nr:TetR/AcrR family transcriptional regulator [Baekduia sp.]
MTVATQRTRRRQQREETRRQILDAAQAFLQERPYRELSVDALMGRTGHTRTVFYRHFDDIPSLVLALMQDVGGELVEVSQQWARADAATPEEARKGLAMLVDFHVRYGRLVHAVAEASHHDDVVEEAYASMREWFVTLTTQAIERRIAQGGIAALDAPQIARALLAMLNGYLDETLGRDSGTDPERVLDAVWTIWTRTLFPGRAGAGA